MRKGKIERNTKETRIKLEVNIDGTGKYRIDTGMPFFDHMLSLMAKHGLMDLKLTARGDLEVDYHHTVEDAGIALGKALKEALGDMKGIRRYGFASVPMDESLAQASLDISGRAYLVYKPVYPKKSRIKDFEVDLVEDFLLALTSNAGLTLHISAPYGRNIHHMVEAVFKALGRAIMEAAEIEPRSKGAVPSTKGKI